MLLNIVSCFQFLYKDLCTTILSLILGYLVYYFVKFYLKIKSLPPGPIPLPIVGNLLLFRGTKVQHSLQIIEMSKKYGSVFTLWMGPNPFVFVLDLDLAKESFNRNELSGRPDSMFGKLVSNDKYTDILFADFGPKWQALRRVAHLAVRKYSTTDQLAYLVSDVVDQTVQLIIDKEDIEHGFQPFDYIYLLFLNIMANSVFGKKYDMEDPEFKKLNYIFHDFFKEHTTRLSLVEFLPIMRFIDRSIMKKRDVFMDETRDLVKGKYISHYKDFNESIVRDFCDALILAKNEALLEGKESAPYLNDDNITMVVWDLFVAGVDTTHNTFKWLLLLAAYYPEVQNRLRQEINDKIGDRMPVQQDIHECHYIQAFISETMRYRLVVPLALFHKAVVKTNIGIHTIPEGTGVFLNLYSILNDEKHWANPDQFRPERFLDSEGRYVTVKPQAYVPFGVGRRICLGEKLAIVELFMVLVRFLQSTTDYDIRVTDGTDLEPNYHINEGIIPNDYKIMFKRK